jgi:RHS repeat-associated protein
MQSPPTALPRLPPSFMRLLPRPRRPRTLPLLAAFAVLLGSRPLAAQDEMPPRVDITPAGTTFTSPQVIVTVRFRDEVSLNTATRSIVFNGAAAAQFSHAEVTQNGLWLESKSTGMVTLQPGINTLSATICDDAGNCGASGPVTYTFVGRPEVRVTPDGGTGTVIGNTTSSQVFRVANPGLSARTYTLRARCRQAWTGTYLAGCAAPGSVSVAAGDSVPVTVTYPATFAGEDVFVWLEATAGPGVADAGWIDVQTLAPPGWAQPAMEVHLANLNSTATVDRTQCVTVAIAPGAAMECGDLRLSHGLPAVHVMGRTRAPVLLYNSRHAQPTPAVYANLYLAGSAQAPSSVEVLVTRGGATLASRTYPGSEFVPGTSRRVALTWTEGGATAATGVYGYDLQVTVVYGGVRVASSASGAYALVNRAASELGPGWWLAGVERLHPLAAGGFLWVGGDGSTRVYTPAGTGKWGAPTLDRPDTLYASTYPGAAYERRLPGGTRVIFSSTGRHVATVNRLRQHTRFVYDAAGRLDAVDVPRAAGLNAPRLRYAFGKNASGRVTSITTPDLNNVASRTVTLGRDGSHRLTGITGPANDTIAFGYQGNDVVSRTDRMGVQTRFTYGAARTVSSARMELAAATPTSPADSLVYAVAPAEGKGFAAAVPLLQVSTVLDGPRTDVEDRTVIWPIDYGAPYRVRDPSGTESILYRNDPRFPVLVTEVLSADASGSVATRSTAAYDTRGRLSSTTALDPLGDGQNVATSYTWDDTWDAVRTITVPGMGVTTLEYDPATGNRTGEYVGDPSRGVSFRYHADSTTAVYGALKAIQYPAAETTVDSLVYDGYGNLSQTVSPTGLRTLSQRDSLGRVTRTYTPIDSATALDTVALKLSGAWTRTTYDAMDRPRTIVSWGPARAHAAGTSGWAPRPSPAEEVTVTTTYDAEGRVTYVSRETEPHYSAQTTGYGYDRAGRRTWELNGGAQLQQFAYDKAGNVVAWTTPRGFQITTRYDVMGRPTVRAVPGVTAPAQCVTLVRMVDCRVFPLRPNSGPDYAIPADTTWMRYDLLGRMVYAENRDAIVERGYYPGGALRTDTLRLRQYAGSLFSQHVYGLRYTYDTAGRMRTLWHPGNLAAAGAQRDTFDYDPMTGVMNSTVDRHGNWFGFQRDRMGRDTATILPGVNGGIHVEGTAYDREGRVTRRTFGPTTDPAAALDERLFYDARGKIVRVDEVHGTASTQRQWYSGLGNLWGTEWDLDGTAGYEREQYVVDGLGNLHEKRGDPTDDGLHESYFDYAVDLTFGRVNSIIRRDSLNLEPFDNDSTVYSYDPSGNQYLSRQTKEEGGFPHNVIVRSYYGADERVHAVQRIDEGSGGNRGVWEEYRYDPLGRRVLVRAVRQGQVTPASSGYSIQVCTGTGTACVSTVTRYVWAGDQVLWEMRSPGADGQNLENTTALGAAAGQSHLFGRVSYLHAGGIDRPLTIWKENVGSVLPHQNWRGLFSRGTWGYNSMGAVGTTANCVTINVNECLPLNWPGERTTAWHESGGESELWMGGLVDGMRDPTGQIYIRNRYYNPQTGQFTQMDPIGIAGGLNAYGFAAGDPVTYSDPYGLCPASMVNHDSQRCPGGLSHGEYYMREDGFQELTPNDPSIASTCKGVARCRAGVRWADDAVTSVVRGTIRRRLLTQGFCAEIRRAAFEAVDRGLAIIPDGVGFVGEAPYAYPPYPRPGRLMFLGRSQLRNGHAISHEALHGVMKNALDPYFHGEMTPLGVTFEQAAWDCSRGGG